MVSAASGVYALPSHSVVQAVSVYSPFTSDATVVYEDPTWESRRLA
jgi:hypothetical protein